MRVNCHRQIVFFGNDFLDFYNKQTRKVRTRIDWTLGLVRDLERIPSNYFKHIEGTELYEIRVSSGSDIFRIFCFFDKGMLVIVLNGFQKKTQKTPRKEIDKALKLQKLYKDGQKK
ncbi:MAG: type II toxin-antitoxin system RelE/ParE family toxin [Flavobacteriales bacterium]|nr:type II toxin-antitoxin system RelE/ParE family toxin [Flavobacteriales bacterium]MCB9449767.1 type II toxin-antitoxin system RelE/ParE family toxin [Flavobacteriales bacterium]